LVEFAYNNSWHASIKCAPFEMLYGRKCRAPICWDQVEERIIEGPEMIEVTNEKVAVAKEKLKDARTRQKSYADKHRRSLEFQPGDHVFLKVSPARGVRRFEDTSIILFMSFHIRLIRSVQIYLTSKNLRLFWIVKIESRGTRLFLLSKFFGGTIPSGKPLGKLRSLFGLLILIS
nr:putative nucleotidyltransferase, ribonuclease H [Tanacetum cinerariifolium]